MAGNVGKLNFRPTLFRKVRGDVIKKINLTTWWAYRGENVDELNLGILPIEDSCTDSDEVAGPHPEILRGRRQKCPEGFVGEGVPKIEFHSDMQKGLVVVMGQSADLSNFFCFQEL